MPSLAPEAVECAIVPPLDPRCCVSARERAELIPRARRASATRGRMHRTAWGERQTAGADEDWHEVLPPCCLIRSTSRKRVYGNATSTRLWREWAPREVPRDPGAPAHDEGHVNSVASAQRSVTDSKLPSGSFIQATLAPDGALHTPCASCSREGYL
jgi:hypothetical protein